MRAKLVYCAVELGASPRNMLLHNCIYLSMPLTTVDQRVRGGAGRSSCRALGACWGRSRVLDG